MSGIWVKRTPAAKRFRERAGFANHRLNTIVVGLEAVRRGAATKPSDLAVHWNPGNVQTAADQARGYATNAIMVYVIDALDTYLHDIARDGIWISDPVSASILANEFQVDRSETKPLSSQVVQQFSNEIGRLDSNFDALEAKIREFTIAHFGRRRRPSLRLRFETLVDLVGVIQTEYTDAVHFLISWRNRHVHGRATDRVSKAILSNLRHSADFFYDTHAHLDVDRMITNYEKGGSPTLKEVSSLISIMHRVVSTSDSVIITRTAARDAFVAALKSGFALIEEPEQRVKRYWGKDTSSRQSKIISIASQFGFQKILDDDPSEKPLFLSIEEIREISDMERDEFIDLLGIHAAPTSS